MSAKAAYTPRNPCPICGGHRDLPQGRGIRCYGYTDNTGDYARCTREELAGAIAQNDDATYSHLLRGACRCGKEHGPAAPKAAATVGRGNAELVRTSSWRAYSLDGSFAIHRRWDYSDGRKSLAWFHADGQASHNSEIRSTDKLYGLASLDRLRPALLVEGEKAADAVRAMVGDRYAVLATVCGAPTIPDAEVLAYVAGKVGPDGLTIWADNDAQGAKQMGGCAATVLAHNVTVRRVTWPDAPAHGDAADYCAAHGKDELLALLEAAKPWGAAQTAASANGSEPARGQPAETVEPRSLRQVEAVWAKWMAVAERDKAADLYSLHIVLGTYAANRIAGDPVWMMVVAGSGSGKTEAARSISGLPDVRLRSSITGVAALLSATPKKDRTAGATGGLLREVGEFGVIVLKDFTTILSMHREARAEILAALREIYDGEWTRSVGTEGARTLSWKGKVGLVAASTAAVDNAHAALSVMGSRFLFARLPDVGWGAQGGRAIRQGSKEAQMHKELAEAVRGLLENLPAEAPELEDAMVDPIVEVANLAALARSPVERDYRGEIELVGDREAPTRIAKQLAQLYRGLLWIGMDERDAWVVVARVSLDSIPKLRRAVVDVLYASDPALTTRKVAGLVNHPKTTTERALEDLDAHGVIDRNGDEQGQAFTWTLSDLARAAYTLATTEPEMSEGAIRQAHNDHISPRLDTSLYEPSRVQDDFSGSVTPIRKACPDGHTCSQTTPTGSLFCCGHPVGVMAE